MSEKDLEKIKFDLKYRIYEYFYPYVSFKSVISTSFGLMEIFCTYSEIIEVFTELKECISIKFKNYDDIIINERIKYIDLFISTAKNYEN